MISSEYQGRRVMSRSRKPTRKKLWSIILIGIHETKKPRQSSRKSMRPTRLWAIKKRRKTMINSDLPRRILSERVDEIHPVLEQGHHDAQADQQAMRIFSQDSAEALDRREGSSSISETSSVDEPHTEDQRGIQIVTKRKRNISNISM